MKTPLALATALSLLVAAPAGALDDTKPTAPCSAQFKDKAGDAVAAAGTTAPSDNLDFTGGFYKYDASKGDDATTINFSLKDLSTAVPTGANAVTWQYSVTLDANYFVRAQADFTGAVAYDYGHSVANPTGAATYSVRDGAVNGKMWEGKDGVIQIVLPAATFKPGTALKGGVGQAFVSRQALPASAPTPVRGGLSSEEDNMTGSTWVVGPCAAAAAPEPAPATGKPATPAPAFSGVLKVKLVTKAAKHAAKGKTLKLKLKASESVTNLQAQLKKGSKVFGKGKLAKLSGTGTFKLKLSRKLPKGSYLVDFAGDTAGGHKLVTLKLKIR